MSAAAQVLGMSQPTVSRQISALEDRVGFNLFDRSCNGLKLTVLGEGLLASAQQTARGVEGFMRKVNASNDHHEGHVRLAVSEVAAFYYLPQALKAFNAAFPHIEVEILVNNQDVNLNKREADVQISRQRHTQPDLVVSHLYQHAVGFFAHQDYIAEYGMPTSLEHMHGRDFHIIGFDQLDLYTRTAAQLGKPVVKSQFPYRTDSYMMQLELVRAKAGIAAMYKEVAQRHVELVPVFPDAPIPPAQWWLVCHRDVHVNPRIRHLMVFLSRWFDTLTPTTPQTITL
ncbi:LysR family transcriptional regulator [Photobacterium japonica]